MVSDRPQYDRRANSMLKVRTPLAGGFAEQVLRTCGPFLRVAASEAIVLDAGCGYGRTTLELARRCARVLGIEVSADLYDSAAAALVASGLSNAEFRRQSVYDLKTTDGFDLIVLDNVLEHLPDQPRALRILSDALKPGGVLYILVPNKLWPIEVHYSLPFLSYLPLRCANLYLRVTGRGRDYTDASYAPTYFGLCRLLDARTELTYRFVLPADIRLATAGDSWHYRFGTALLRRYPWLWVISKAFLVVAVKR
jgi:SAM-dependent methyltransferase